MSTSEPQVLLTCFVGPDQGKRVAIADGSLLLGSSTDCNVLSDDPDVAARHVRLTMHDGSLSLTGVDGAPVYIDGHVAPSGAALRPGQQLRVGRSVWRLTTSGGNEGFVALIDKLGERISTAAGVEKIQGFSVGQMFSEVLRRRTPEEVEEYFTVGTSVTTPPLAAIDTNWPRPWAFARAFLFSLAAYALLVYGYREFENPYFLPGIIVLGSIAFPLAILVFFFEMNVVRNISVYRLFRLVVFGGIFSLVISLFGFRYTNLSSWMGAMSAGIVEEAGKLIAVAVIAHRGRYRGTLNGLLIGAAVGTGFSVFETMGYVMIQGLEQFGVNGMFEIITRRGWLNLLGDHALWTGMVGAALWRVSGDQPFRWEMLKDTRFVRVFALAIALHMINNAPIPLPVYGKYVAIGFVAWVVLLSFIQTGLKEVREAQLRSAGAGRPAGASVAG
jgi:RsiW-degrading membrane proteinase PrsW (M82 family)